MCFLKETIQSKIQMELSPRSFFHRERATSIGWIYKVSLSCIEPGYYFQGIWIFNTLQFTSHSCYLRTGGFWRWWAQFLSVKFCSCTYNIQMYGHLAASSCGICSDTSSCLDLTPQTKYTSVSVTCISVLCHHFKWVKNIGNRRVE